jgi:hypothetical protein
MEVSDQPHAPAELSPKKDSLAPPPAPRPGVCSNRALDGCQSRYGHFGEGKNFLEPWTLVTVPTTV